MRRGSVEAAPSWWSRVAMSGRSVAWRFCRRLHPVDIHERTAQWRHEGWTGYDATAMHVHPNVERGDRDAQRPGAGALPRHGWRARERRTRRVEGQEEVTIPVVEEDLAIGKREVERGHVRIDSRVTEQPVEEAVRLREEKVTVERRPVDRPATEADFAAAAKEVIEMTETAEEPVVTKRARVVEEVVVHKEVTEHTETVRETVRRTDVDVQREPETATERRRSTAPKDFAAYDAVFRQHYTTALADRGTAYIEYEPAYRYGYDAGHRRALPGARLGRAGSRRPPRLGSTPPQHLGALQRRHPACLGGSREPALTFAPAGGRVHRRARPPVHSPLASQASGTSRWQSMGAGERRGPWHGYGSRGDQPSSQW